MTPSALAADERDGRRMALTSAAYHGGGAGQRLATAMPIRVLPPDQRRRIRSSTSPKLAIVAYDQIPRRMIALRRAVR